MKVELFSLAIFATALSGCTTPKVMLKNPETGQIAICGGSSTGSMMGGVIGYNIDKSNSARCEADYMAQGFEPIQRTPGTTGDR